MTGHDHAVEMQRTGLDWWLCGNAHALVECRGSLPVAVFEVMLSIVVIAFYVAISFVFRRLGRQHGRAGRRATEITMDMLSNVFLWCAFCGYGFPVLELVYPAITIKLIAMVALTMQAITALRRMPELENAIEQQIDVASAAAESVGTTDTHEIIKTLKARERELSEKLELQANEISEILDAGNRETARMIQDRVEKARSAVRPIVQRSSSDR